MTKNVYHYHEKAKKKSVVILNNKKCYCHKYLFTATSIRTFEARNNYKMEISKRS